MRARMVLVGWVVCLAGVLVSPARAQEPLTFVDVEIEESFVITLPAEWLTWVQSAYTSFDEADRAAVDLLLQVFPGSELTTPFMLPENALLSLPLDQPADGALRLNVDMLSLDDFAGQMGITADFVSAEALAEAQAASLGGQLATTTTLNGREAAFALSPFNGQPLMSVTTVFPEADRIAVVSLSAPDSFFESEEALALFVLSTLRQSGEPIAGAALLALTGAEAPDDWTLPDAIVYVEPTPQPVVCLLRASQNVNLRGGAGTNFPVMGSLNAGTTTAALRQTQGSDGMIWFQVESGAWVRADVVGEDASCTALPFVEPE